MARYEKAKGRPLSKIYKRVGIRRDNNLGDLSNSAEGLENLLDSLIVDTGETFLVDDLNSIKNIFSRGLEAEEYRKIIGSAVRFTTPVGETASFDPRITYQNRLDKFELFTGTPRLAGGNGLTAKYYQNDQINFNSLTSFQYNKSNGDPFDPNLPESNVFLPTTSEGLIPNDNFWEQGNFAYTGKVHPQSVKASGGVEWEGYYIPRETGTAQFSVSSTGFFTADFSKDNYFEDDDKKQTSASQAAQLAAGIGTNQIYTSYIRVGLSTVMTGTGGVGNEITVPLNRLATIGIGMSVSGTNVNSTGGAPVVSGIARDTGIVTLEPVSGQTNSVTGTLSGTNNITFSRPFGQEVSSSFQTQILVAYEKYRVKFRYFHPRVGVGDTVLNNQIRSLDKNVTIHHQFPGRESIDEMNFRYLYSLDYDFSEAVKGGFNRYLDQSVLFGGTDLGVGIGNRTNFNEYTRLKSFSKVNLKYKVKNSLAKITKVNSRPGTFSGGSKIISINPSDTTSNIEVGNYVFGTNIPVGARVESIAINKFIILSDFTGGSGSQTQNLKYIDHRGFVKKITCNGSGNTISNANPALRSSSQNSSTIDKDVQVGMVVIGANTEQNSFTTITNISGTTGLTLSQNLASNFTNGDIFIYQSRGLKDNSIQNFCDRFNSSPEIRCLRSNHVTTDVNGNPITYTTQIGISTVKVSDLNGVGAGWELQGAYFGANGITVSSILPNNVLQLNAGMTRPLPDDAQFTAVSPNQNQNGDYQLCCPPTDTSPPFNASEEGLDTVSGTSPNMEIHKGNLKFDSLIIQDTNSNVSDASSTDVVNLKIDIKTPLSGNYKLLAFESTP